MKEKRCYLCNNNSISWDNDIDAEQISEKRGIMHYYHCRKCGARITFYEAFENDFKGEE
jgi:transcription initiation factor IIE alpha subunit